MQSACTAVWNEQRLAELRGKAAPVPLSAASSSSSGSGEDSERSAAGDSDGGSTSDEEDGGVWGLLSARSKREQGWRGEGKVRGKQGKQKPPPPPPPATVEVWRRLKQTALTSGLISEYILLAEIAFVLVPGSVEDERRFSIMKYVKSLPRNRLDRHLGLCVRMMSQELLSQEGFPYDAALKHWEDAAGVRGRYNMSG